MGWISVWLIHTTKYVKNSSGYIRCCFSLLKEGSRLAALFRICVYLCSASNFFRKSTRASTPSLGIAL